MNRVRPKMALAVPEFLKHAPVLPFIESNPVQRAIYRGSTRTLRSLLRLGSDANTRCGRLKQTPLMLVCYSPDRNKRSLMTDLLIAGGADERLTDRNGWNALFYACALGISDVAASLINNAKVELTAADKEGNTVLHVCAMEGHSAILMLLLKEMRMCGSSVNLYNNTGLTPLVVAIAQGQAECARLLHNAGGFPKLSRDDFARILSMAFSHPKIARDLLQSMMPAGSKLEIFSRSVTSSSLPITEIHSCSSASGPPSICPSEQGTDKTLSSAAHSSASHDNNHEPTSMSNESPEGASRVLSELPKVPPSSGKSCTCSGHHVNVMATSRYGVRKRTVTYPCNHIISALLNSSKPRLQLPSLSTCTKTPVPISPEWLEAVKHYRQPVQLPTHFPSSKPMPLTSPIPTTSPRVLSRTATRESPMNSQSSGSPPTRQPLSTSPPRLGNMRSEVTFMSKSATQSRRNSEQRAYLSSD